MCTVALLRRDDVDDLRSVLADVAAVLGAVAIAPRGGHTGLADEARALSRRVTTAIRVLNGRADGIANAAASRQCQHINVVVLGDGQLDHLGVVGRFILRSGVRHVLGRLASVIPYTDAKIELNRHRFGVMRIDIIKRVDPRPDTELSHIAAFEAAGSTYIWPTFERSRS